MGNTSDDRAPDAEHLGVFGGTFDPVHIGHLVIATELRWALNLDRVLFVPAGQPPHKAGQIVSPDADRWEMLRLALAGTPGFAISDVELERPGPSYTAETLAELHRRWPAARLVFLMGEDSLRDLPDWRSPGAIVALAELAVAGRPGVEVDLAALYARVPEARGRVRIVPVPEMGIAARDLRQRVARGAPIRFQVPPAVETYIAAHELYRRPAARPATPIPAPRDEG